MSGKQDAIIRLMEERALFQSLPGVLSNKPTRTFPVQEGFNVHKVSAVIITYNEERIIARTLEQLGWCDEVIVIDSGSTDETVQICEDFGCKVFTNPFKGFGEQKNFGVSKAKNDWVLCLDADEILTKELIHEIRTEMAQSEINFAGFAIPRNLVFMNKVFKYGKEAHAPVIRLFNKELGQWDGAVVHEKVVLDGSIKTLKHKLLHYSYKDYSNFLDKINLYSSLGAKKMLTRKSGKSQLVVTLGLPFNFFKYYVLERNFLNGYSGFAWSVLSTLYHFLKYLKLKELQNKNNISFP